MDSTEALGDGALEVVGLKVDFPQGRSEIDKRTGGSAP